MGYELKLPQAVGSVCLYFIFLYSNVIKDNEIFSAKPTLKCCGKKFNKKYDPWKKAI